MMPGMRTIRQTIVVLVSMPGFFVWLAAFANDEAEHHLTLELRMNDLAYLTRRPSANGRFFI